MADSTRERIVNEALRLFAEQGYAGTSVASIEKAAGLSPHSGAMYTHFGSKEQVLAAAVDRAVEVAETGFALAPLLPLGNLEAELTLIARGSLLLMTNWRHLIRVMMRETEAFPAVMAEARKRLFTPSYDFLAARLAERAKEEGRPDRDFQALAAIWLGAIENFWVMTHVYGGPPFEMDEDRFVQQWVGTLLAAIGAQE